jgi:nucleoside-diphosphate-sugar epimerase
MKILVIGGAGFTGFHLARNLADENNSVTICDNLFKGTADEDFNRLVKRANVEFTEIDLTQRRQLNRLDKDFDIVYHLAAISGVRHFYAIPHEVLRINILSLINVLDWLVVKRCKRLVWTSSAEVYSGTESLINIPVPTPETVPLAIADVYNPRFSYAGSKIVGELLCLSYAKAFDFNVSIVRPSNIYGPRMGYDQVIPQFIQRILLREKPFKIHGGNQIRAFCFVDDFVRGMRLIGESLKVSGEIINLGSGREEIGIEDLANKMFDLFNYHPKLELLPPPEGSASRRVPDISKARALVGYEPQIGLDTGLKVTCDWYRQKLSR